MNTTPFLVKNLKISEIFFILLLQTGEFDGIIRKI